MIADNLDALPKPRAPAIAVEPIPLLGDVSVVWRGTNDETTRLMTAVHRNAVCDKDMDCCDLDITTVRCGAHDMLNSQRVLDGLLFMRRYYAGVREARCTITTFITCVVVFATLTRHLMVA